MPPNTESRETLLEAREPVVKFPEEQEIYYNGYYYNVSNFISRHPGGKVIEFYLDKREDATIPIQQFHGESIKKVLAIMNSLPKRRATLFDRKFIHPNT